MAGNLRIARNATILYTNTIINMIVGFFTAGIMLDALGVDDYGLQAVAGSGIALFGFIVTVLSTSTSRFITYELGRGDAVRTNLTFCTALILFSGLALIMATVAETAGMWILHHKLNVPAGRMGAAEFIIHASAVSSLVTLPQAPYSAVLIAREKFGFTSVCNISGTFARLIILLFVKESGYDHLILYTVLMTALSFVITLIMRFYCIRRFPEARFRPVFSREQLRPMIRFSFWELFGSMGRTIKNTVYPMAVNIFHGVTMNAAIGIGTTLSGAVTGMAFTLVSAFKPTMVKQYAADCIDDMKSSIINATLLSMVLYGMFAVPLLVELDYVMELWLGTTPPPLAIEVCVIQLIINTLLMAYLVPVEALKSMDHNKGINMMQCIGGIITIGMVWFVLSLGLSPLWACVVFECGLLPSLIVTIVLVHRHLGGRFIRTLIIRSIIPVVITDAVIFVLLFTVSRVLGHSPVTLITVCCLSVILFSLASLRLLPPQERNNLLAYLRNHISNLLNIKANAQV